MRCPSCGTRLVELERSEVLIDACPECRGVWLDRASSTGSSTASAA